MVEFGLFRKTGVDHPAAAGVHGPRHQLRQPVIGLWAENEIDERRAPANLIALGLRDAAGHRDEHGGSPARFARLQRTHLAEFGKDLFCRLFADVAGVKDDQISVSDHLRPVIAEWRQQLGHSS